MVKSRLSKKYSIFLDKFEVEKKLQYQKKSV